VTLLECLQTFLMGDATLAAKLPGGLRPQIIPQGSNFPMATVKMISASGEQGTHDGGASPWVRMRLELTVWGTDFKTQEQTLLYMLGKFEPFNGYLGGSTNGRFAVTGLNGPRSIQDEATKLVGVQLDVLGMLNRSTLS